MPPMIGTARVMTAQSSGTLISMPPHNAKTSISASLPRPIDARRVIELEQPARHQPRRPVAQVVARVDDLEVVEREQHADRDHHQAEDRLHRDPRPLGARRARKLHRHRTPRINTMMPLRTISSGQELWKSRPKKCICDAVIQAPSPISHRPEVMTPFLTIIAVPSAISTTGPMRRPNGTSTTPLMLRSIVPPTASMIAPAA